MFRAVIVVGFVAALLAAVSFAPRRASAIESGSAACQRELQDTRKKMQESLAVIASVKDAPASAKCPAFAAASDLVEEIRESKARCEPPDARVSAVRDADDVIDAINEQYQKWCPPRSGLVRVRATWVTMVTRDKLPKPLAALHTCVDEDVPISSSDERFDLGRIFMLGCPGIENPSDEQIKQRNTRIDLLKKEQTQVYLTRDRDGDDAKRLVFPILTADGREVTTDMLIGGRVSVGQKRDLISAYWEPVKDGVCRVHAVWRVADGKPRLVLWQEATDCSKGSKTEFKTVLDRR
jgi:hypothetical protein